MALELSGAANASAAAVPAAHSCPARMHIAFSWGQLHDTSDPLHRR